MCPYCCAVDENGVQCKNYLGEIDRSGSRTDAHHGMQRYPRYRSDDTDFYRCELCKDYACSACGKAGRKCKCGGRLRPAN